jgi:hypothetical protein
MGRGRERSSIPSADAGGLTISAVPDPAMAFTCLGAGWVRGEGSHGRATVAVVVVTYLAGKLALCSRISADDGSPLAPLARFDMNDAGCVCEIRVLISTGR